MMASKGRGLKGPIARSPLRYPGGKSRAVKRILPIIPEFVEVREPFVGGGSVFLAIKQRIPLARYWINDKNRGLWAFWTQVRDDVDTLVDVLMDIRKEWAGNGKGLYLDILENEPGSLFEAAIRFFVLNRITFSGTVESGGYSENAFNRRFTESSILRVKKVAPVLQDVEMTNEDYEKSVMAPGEDVFIFLDPPYLSATKSRLYGKRGGLHLNFDHQRFARLMSECPHTWLITYDDSPEVRDLYPYANKYTWTLQYGMNNYKQCTAAPGNELFISNYDIPSLEGCRVL